MEFSQHEKELEKKWVKKTEFIRISEYTLVCLLILENDYEIVGSDTVSYPNTFNEKMYVRAKKRALERLYEYVEFYRQETRNRFYDANFSEEKENKL